MNEKDISQMALEARLTDSDLNDWMTDYGYCKNEILKFSCLVAATAIEELILKLADLWDWELDCIGFDDMRREAAKIRRGDHAP